MQWNNPADYEIFFFEKCEIKFALSYAVRHISHCEAIFHSEAISLALGKFHQEKALAIASASDR